MEELILKEDIVELQERFNTTDIEKFYFLLWRERSQMYKQKYDTNFGAIWNLISNRNYTTSLLYKSLYLLYYFITITVVLELLFHKTYMILAAISSIIIVINGRKYDDSEQQFIEYLPISLKDKVRYIYYTTYITLFFGGIISLVLDYIYR